METVEKRRITFFWSLNSWTLKIRWYEIFGWIKNCKDETKIKWKRGDNEDNAYAYFVFIFWGFSIKFSPLPFCFFQLFLRLKMKRKFFFFFPLFFALFSIFIILIYGRDLFFAFFSLVLLLFYSIWEAFYFGVSCSKKVKLIKNDKIVWKKRSEWHILN